MAYFVTGATGFIGRFLVENLLKRGAPVYALVRKGSQKKLDALRDTLGVDDKRLIGVLGDLPRRRGSRADLPWRSQQPLPLGHGSLAREAPGARPRRHAPRSNSPTPT
jgi:NAD(P)-dependent dehydrogenase (short-subunit alcohol dehydrogenase family)